MTSTIRPTAAPRPPFFRRPRVGFTLLEILLALALIAVLLAGVSAITSLYSRNYTTTERRVGRAQLARSISQMLSEDLGAAVQDPIQAVADDPNRQFIRRFGLRGDSRSLQIDVVQPNLFATTATPEENRRVAEGGKKSTESRQVPELKTIFYEFVPLNALEPLDDEENGATAELDAAFETETGGSSLTGSLSTPAGATGADGTFGAEDEYGATLDGTTGTIADGIFTSADGTTTFRPLTRKFGLSRRELDFETPIPGAEVAAVDDPLAEYEAAAEEGRAVSTLTGSLSAPPDASQTTLAGNGFIDGTGALEGTSTDATATAEAENPFDRLPLTAAQVAMDADDGTTWAPEALDCRFRYFDGENWLDAWDGIEKGGLPVAIKVDLKLAPLDDVDLYRSSPLLFNLPIPPEPSAIASAADASNADSTDPTALTSQLTGSLTGGPPTAAASNGPGVDVFNSYRPLAAIRIAQTAPPLTAFAESTATNASAAATSNGTESDADDELGSTATSSDLGGGLSGGFASTATDAAFDGATQTDLTGGLGGTSFADALAGELGLGATAASNSFALATFNEKGICVDYANDGSYVTLEGMAAELGLSQPQVFELVVYLPTTPSGRARTVERRRPTTVREGAVAVGGRARPRTPGFSGPRTPGANPYATGTAREVRRRTPERREFNERTAASRGAAERTAATRGAANRSAGTREGVDRTAATRAAVGRGASQRAATQRQLRTREIGPAPGGLDSELAAALDAEGGVFGEPVGATEEFAGTATVGDPASGPDPDGLGSATVGGFAGGGLGGGGTATTLGPVQTTLFSDESAGFADPASGLGADALVPGLIETSTAAGAQTTVAPTAPAQTAPRRTQQTWIRGR
ncbi:MAG: prepilin-type N-terminal cleavage/methylation domain-containing protein [Thermoguttaceae bacterium]|nr:prepilin-type N-terminal cleavage/methylation domain-containing protein [Thermoguttaceae bacterium]